MILGEGTLATLVSFTELNSLLWCRGSRRARLIEKDHSTNELQDEKRSRPNVIGHIQFQTELPREENEPTAKEMCR